MASKSTLNSKNLEALGVERLAQLLIEISTGDANAKRRLRMELAGVESPLKLAHEIRKRLSSIAAATTFIGWRSLKAFKVDLQNQRRLIAELSSAPGDALDLMCLFLGLATGVLERTADASGEVLEIFRQASLDLPGLARAAHAPLADLVQKACAAVLDNSYGQADPVIPGLAPLLGPAGLTDLREAVRLAAKDLPARPSPRGRKTSRWRRGRRLERETVQRRPEADRLHRAYLDIADALGDIDAYIALQSDLRAPAIAARVARRLLQAGRAEEALATLDAARKGAKEIWPVEWETARIDALDALDRRDEAQAFRLERFHLTLNPDPLRAYLKRLPDFDDIEAEDAAIDYAVGYANADAALAFLVAWPNLERAAQLVTTRPLDLDGNDEDVLEPAATKLEAKYPLAATLVLRRLIDAVLLNARSRDYERAADWLADCARLAAHIADFGAFEDHYDYVERLRSHFRHRRDFWDAAL